MLLLILALLWSVTFIFIKLAAETIPVFSLVLIRVGMAALVLHAMILIAIGLAVIDTRRTLARSEATADPAR